MRILAHETPMIRLRVLIALALLPAVQIASAQPAVITNTLPGCNFTTGQLTAACIPLFIGHLIQLVMGLVGTFFLFNIMFAGYQIAIGAWSGEKSKGKDRLLWSIIGLIICASAFLILDVVLTVVVG